MRKALFALTFLIAAVPAAAQPRYHTSRSGQFEITPLAGFRLAGEFNAGNDRFDDGFLSADAEIEEGEFYGAILGIPLTSNWKLELLANRQDSTFIIDEGLFGPVVELGDLTLSYYHAGLAYEWGLGQVRPFITGSLGLARFDPDFPELNAENRFSGSLGGGVKIFFSEAVGLRLEGRGYWTDLGFDDDDDRFDRYDSDEGLYQGEASAGLIIAF
jgi:hypothetical protein